MKKGIWLSENEFVELPADRTSLTQEIASRQRSMDFYTIAMYLPDPDPVLRKQGKDIRVYQELQSDPRVGACVESRQAGVTSLDWVLQGKGIKRDILVKLYKRLDMDRIISEILEAPLFGFQPLEVLWEFRDSMILPQDIVGKPQEWFTFDRANRLRFKTKESPISGEALPERKFICPQHKPTYKNPYGKRVLSRVFWPVAFKKGGMKFWVTFAEKYGMPFILGKQPRGIGDAETKKFLANLENMVQDAVAVIPDDASVDIVEAGGKGASGDIYKGLKESCDEDITIGILGQNLTTSVKEGSLAASQSHMQVRKDITDSDKKIVEKTLNQLNRWIDELNWGGAGEDLPIFTFIDDEDDTALANRDKTISETGVKFTKPYFVRKYGFADDEIEVPAPSPASPGGSAFAERKNAGGSFIDQEAIDAAIGNIPPEKLQMQMEGVLTPVIDMITQGKDHNAIMTNLAEAYPTMDTAALEEMLARSIFVSELWGRLNAKDGD